jgi:Ca-activated chloride channel family protein
MRRQAIVCLACVWTAATLAAQTPAFSSRVEAVRINALVTDGQGQPILGLGARDFEIVDAGIPQRVDLVLAERLPVNVVLALDSSGSVAGEQAAQLQTAGRAVIDNLKPDDKAALVTFSAAVSVRAALTPNLALVRNVIDDEKAQLGDSSVVDAAYAAMLLAEADAARGLVILFTDGEDTSSALTAASVVESGRRADAVVYAVVAGKPDAPRFLNDLCKVTGGRVLKVTSMSKLRDTFLLVLEEFRHRYLLSYTPQGVPRNGWHPLTVRVKNRRAVVNARPGYVVGP